MANRVEKEMRYRGQVYFSSELVTDLAIARKGEERGEEGNQEKWGRERSEVQ